MAAGKAGTEELTKLENARPAYIAGAIAVPADFRASSIPAVAENPVLRVENRLQKKIGPLRIVLLPPGPRCGHLYFNNCTISYGLSKKETENEDQ